MRSLFAAILASAGLVLVAGSAGAAQLVPLVDTAAEAPSVTLVAQGCGLGYSRGAYGRCRSSVFGFGGPRRYYRGYGYPRYGYAPRGYYGYRRGFY